jgi:hypothetical protein
MFSKYPDFARLLLANRLQPDEGADTSPLYLLLNVALGPQPLRILQSVLGSVAVVAVFFVARALFGRVAAWLALAMVTLAAPLLLYEATLEPDLLILAVNVVALAVLVTATEERLLRRAILAGALLGLSAALRPSNLALLGVALLWLVWSQRGAGRRRVLRVAGAGLAAALAMLVLPIVVVRVTVGSQLTATMSAGIMLHICNRPEGNGIGYQSGTLVKLLEQQGRSPDHPDPSHALYRRFARAAEGPALSPTACERYWAGRTAAFIRNEPFTWLGLVWAKFLAFLAGPDAHDIADPPGRRRRPSATALPHLTSLGLAGLVAPRSPQLGPLVQFGCDARVSLIFASPAARADGHRSGPRWPGVGGAWSSRRAKGTRPPPSPRSALA